MTERNALLVADLHLHHLPRWRADWLDRFVERALDEWREPGRHLFLLGDVFEIRNKVDARTLNTYLNLTGNWDCGDVVWVSGQHDSYLPGQATLEGLKNFNIQVVDSEVYHHEVSDSWFIPYCRRIEDYRKLIEEVPPDTIVFTHLPLKEAIEMFGASDVNEISVKEFDRFRHTYSGDIHCFHDFDKFSYIGMPSQRDWRDKRAVGKIGLLEGETLTRIDTNCPRHIEIQDASEIVEDGVKHVYKVPRGQTIPPGSALEVTETLKIDVDSLQIKGEGKASVLVQEYVEQNPAEGATKQALISYAKALLPA